MSQMVLPSNTNVKHMIICHAKVFLCLFWAVWQQLKYNNHHTDVCTCLFIMCSCDGYFVSDLGKYMMLGDIIIILETKKKTHSFYHKNYAIVWSIPYWSRSGACGASASAFSRKKGVLICMIEARGMKGIWVLHDQYSIFAHTTAANSVKRKHTFYNLYKCLIMIETVW